MRVQEKKQNGQTQVYGTAYISLSVFSAPRIECEGVFCPFHGFGGRDFHVLLEKSFPEDHTLDPSLSLYSVNLHLDCGQTQGTIHPRLEPPGYYVVASEGQEYQH